VAAKIDFGNLDVSAGGVAIAKIDLASLVSGSVRLSSEAGDHFYGMRGYTIRNREPGLNPDQGLFRDSSVHVRAGSQGDGGAPFAFTSKWGLLVDSIDGDFTVDGKALQFSHGSRKDVEAYVIVGPPLEFMRAVAELTGLPPMPPRWSLGFMNSQWGDDEALILSQVAEYRRRQIPLDAFILDFDFKAWGEDNYGEFRWNSTSGAGSVAPNKFPDGSSGKFAADLLQQGVHVVGIMKPRVLVTDPEGRPTAAAKDAAANNWFLPGEKPYQDYFSHRLAQDIDFSTAGARAWYWDHSRGLFQSGISGWWNDEADGGFPSLGFFQMQQSLYEGQRSISNTRVWSINRNFYLGAQRYAFGTWSGDISSGFSSMKAQTWRMLAMLDIGQPNWTMDAGGFGGHPSSENYARWMEFAAVCPIMRVHGTYGERRQPWVYGPVAEAAAKKAIELRYRMLPYLYSLAHETNQTGIGAVRPLFWEFPDDSACSNITDSWMLGDAILAAPVLNPGEASRRVYLPAGDWFDYWSDAPQQGGRSVDVPNDTEGWTNIPMFVRAGSIVATEPVRQFTGAPSGGQVTLDVWPDVHRKAHFDFYDDDGSTYDYERGSFRSQAVDATRTSDGVSIVFGNAKGRWHSPIKTFLVRVHGIRSEHLLIGGAPAKPAAVGTTVEFVVPAGKALAATLKAG
jgi:alpha-glucosidase (family GH31 glycosyl hydrolase)